MVFVDGIFDLWNSIKQHGGAIFDCGIGGTGGVLLDTSSFWNKEWHSYIHIAGGVIVTFLARKAVGWLWRKILKWKRDRHWESEIGKD